MTHFYFSLLTVSILLGCGVDGEKNGAATLTQIEEIPFGWWERVYAQSKFDQFVYGESFKLENVVLGEHFRHRQMERIVGAGCNHVLALR